MSELQDSRALPDWPSEPNAELLGRLVDSHAHPTDYRRFLEEKEEYRDCTSSILVQKVSLSHGI